MKLCNLGMVLSDNVAIDDEIVSALDKRKGSITSIPMHQLLVSLLLDVVSFSSYSQSSDPSNGCQNSIFNGDLDEEVHMKQPKGFVMPVDKTKKFLSSSFSMKDMGEADVILDCSPVSTLMDPVEKLKPNTGKPVDQLEYSRAIGCLMYAMTSTRPDIAYAVGRLKAYSDASWINHVEDSSSNGRWVFLLGGGAISWASKKQTCITGSTIKFEFVALTAAGKEAEWLRNLIHEILIWLKPIAPIFIHCDSVATLAKAYSQMYNGKSRHLGVRHSMIRT
ncbi:hypothetical protein Tco_0445357 [Tanacetum coccineum]